MINIEIEIITIAMVNELLGIDFLNGVFAVIIELINNHHCSLAGNDLFYNRNMITESPSKLHITHQTP